MSANKKFSENENYSKIIEAISKKNKLLKPLYEVETKLDELQEQILQLQILAQDDNPTGITELITKKLEQKKQYEQEKKHLDKSIKEQDNLITQLPQNDKLIIKFPLIRAYFAQFG